MLTDSEGTAPVPRAGATGDATPRAWRDPSRSAAQRVDWLLGAMSLEEKVAQLYGVWVAADATGAEVAPRQNELTDPALDWQTLLDSGLGQLTRPFGTAPVEVAHGARALARTQERIVAANRFGIPAQVHEECLSGFTTWGATIYPTPLAWGASFDPALIEAMAAAVGAAMRSVGVHQGLAPVLDVTRDARWGRTEETIGEDPYLVGTIGTAYVKGLESAGLVATLKHFVGYSASRAGRNQAPVGMGARELADVMLPPFEMALREGHARSVMHSYADIDGVPPASDETLLTDLLRGDWGFEGTVVADYFGISFLQLLHQVAETPAEAARLALAAGVDVELPTVRCYGTPLLDAVRSGVIPEALVDRATRRVLLQKCQLGLLDAGWTPMPPALAVDTAGDTAGDPAGTALALDPPPSRALARTVAEESVVLVANDGTLPLRPDARIALVGPLADDPMGMLGCYSFPAHVGSAHPDLPLGVSLPTLLDALRTELPGARIEYLRGCDVLATGTDEEAADGIASAVEAAGRAEVCVVALGDRAGLFGRGTSGEGCDAPDLRLPGRQQQLLDAVHAAGVPVVAVLLSGRPYAIGGSGRLAAYVQAFFPGEEGGPALAGVLAGRVCPSGRLPVGVPRHPGGQPAPYLAPPLGQHNDLSTVDPSPAYPFGHGLSYTTFDWYDVQVNGGPLAPGGTVECAVDGALEVSLAVRNTGARPGAEVVQLYLHDPVAQVTLPVARLIGYARVALEPGQASRVGFRFHADLASFTGREGHRLVEPGDIELRLAGSSTQARYAVPARLVGKVRRVGHERILITPVAIEPA